MVGKIFRFGMSGVVATLASYLGFMVLMGLGLHYLVAGLGAWVCGVCAGFAMNRRFTFQIKGSEGRGRQFRRFLVGAFLQLVLALAGYAILIGRLGMAPTLAFWANLVITTAFSFAFMSLVTFRRHF
jgi:putative flippase GtrA